MSSPEFWLEQLETIHGPRGILGERVLDLIDAEQRHLDAAIRETSIYRQLFDAFFDFYMQSLVEGYSRGGGPHTMFGATLIATFWRLRSGQLLFWNGYYPDALSLLRAVWENALYLAAGAHNQIKFEDLWKLDIDLKTVTEAVIEKTRRKKRRTLEESVHSFMLGKTSGLPETTRDKIQDIVKVLHLNVHRSESAIIDVTHSLLRNDPIGLFPKWDREKASSYVNVSLFIGHCIHRLLPALTTAEHFTDEWMRRYFILDGAYDFAVSSVKPELAGPTTEFIKMKFSFPFAPKKPSTF